LATILPALGTFFMFQDAEPAGTTYLPSARAGLDVSNFAFPDVSADVDVTDHIDEPQYLTVPIRDVQVMAHNHALREIVTESLCDIPYEMTRCSGSQIHVGDFLPG